MMNTLSSEVAREHRKELVREADRRRLEPRLGRTRRSHTASPRDAKAGEQAERNVEIRWGLAEDESGIVELLDLNGMPRRAASEEQYVVAEEDGQLLAAMAYRMAPKRLHLGGVVADPWAGERDLAVALYAGARGLARDMGVREVLARSDARADYPREAGYRRKLGGRRLRTALPS